MQHAGHCLQLFRCDQQLLAAMLLVSKIVLCSIPDGQTCTCNCTIDMTSPPYLSLPASISLPPSPQPRHRIGVAIGDYVLDLSVIAPHFLKGPELSPKASNTCHYVHVHVHAHPLDVAKHLHVYVQVHVQYICIPIGCC